MPRILVARSNQSEQSSSGARKSLLTAFLPVRATLRAAQFPLLDCLCCVPARPVDDLFGLVNKFKRRARSLVRSFVPSDWFQTANETTLAGGLVACALPPTSPIKTTHTHTHTRRK